MKNIFTLIKNISALFMREFVNKGALLVMIFFIGRLLGKSVLGQYTMALTISQILFMATDLGLNTLLIREVAKDKSEVSKYLLNFGATNFILSVVTLLLVGLVTLALNCPKELIFIIYLCAFSYFTIRFIVLFESVFQAFEKMEYRFFISLFKNIIFIPLGIWHLCTGGGLIGLFYLFFIANILTLLMTAFLYIKVIKFRASSLNTAFLKQYILKTFPIWLAQIFAYTYLKIATLFLYKIKGEEAVGIYNAAYILVDGFLIISGIFAMALFPLFSRLYSRSANDLKGAYEKSLNFIIFLSLPVIVSIALLADRIVLLLYGQGFESTAFVMRFLSCTAFLAVFGAVNGYLIITIDKQKIMPYVCGFGLLLNLVLNFTLIPRLSYIGAAMSSVITELVMLSTVLLIIGRYLYGVSITASLLKTMLATTIVGIFIYLFRSINMFILACIAVTLYLTVVYLAKGFVFQEREYIKQLLNIANLTKEDV